MEILLLERNINGYQLQLDGVSTAISDLREIEEKQFEQIESEVGEEEISQKIDDFWQVLYPKYAQIAGSLTDNKSSSQNSTMLLTEANKIGEDFERLIDQRLKSESRELEERTKITQELSTNSTNFLYILTAIAVISSIAAGTLVSRSIAYPITRLVQAARQMSAGNFNVQLSSSKHDEIGELFRQFSDMNEKVRVTNQYLNDLVKSKTRALEHTNEELKRKDRLKDEFISIASHELKTPVHPILEIAEAVKEGLIGQEEAWDLVFKHAKRLQRITNDILDVSRIETGQITYYLTKVPINELIRNVINQTLVNLSKDVQIEIRLDREIEIDGDKDRLLHVFANILDNASKFTKKGKIEIESNVFDERNEIEIKIVDTGTGISPEILPEIFGKFVTKGESGGTGLGLYICKAIVTAHGGKISAHNNEKGATFIIILPIIRKEEEESTGERS